jgi:hypothetical protein
MARLRDVEVPGPLKNVTANIATSRKLFIMSTASVV